MRICIRVDHIEIEKSAFIWILYDWWVGRSSSNFQRIIHWKFGQIAMNFLTIWSEWSLVGQWNLPRSLTNKLSNQKKYGFYTVDKPREKKRSHHHIKYGIIWNLNVVVDKCSHTWQFVHIVRVQSTRETIHFTESIKYLHNNITSDTQSICTHDNFLFVCWYFNLCMRFFIHSK